MPPDATDLSALNADEKRALLARLLERGDRPDVAPLSLPQERLWFLDQLHPGEPTYNIPTAIPFTGPLDVAALERALQELVDRHETLRTTFTRKGLEPVQVVWPHRSMPLAVHDLRRLPPSVRDRDANRLATEEAFRPFDLTRGPLLRAVLVRMADDHAVLLLTMHHIVSDGWSMNVLTSELHALHAAFSAGRPSPLPPLPIQYRDFARRQREELSGDVLEDHLRYWRERLDDAPTLLALPSDHRRPAVQSSLGFVQPFSLPDAVADRLKAVAKDEGATLFMTLLAAFDVFLHRHTGQTDLVVGAPVANRTRPDLEPLIGFFVNTLILRTDVSGDPTFRELLGRVRDVALSAYAHQDVPFERIVEDLQPERDLSRNPLFQVVFAFQNTGPAGGPAPPAGSPVLETRTAKFDITLGMGETASGMAGALEANADLFEAATVSRLADRFVALLESIAADPDRPVSSLRAMRDDELATLLDEWNRTDDDFPEACFHELFEAQADATPDAPAAEFHGEVLTYGALDRRANRLANHLVGMGAGPEVRVAICVERSLDLAVAVLGVMKAGAAYVPLDPNAPDNRTAFIVEDADVEMVVAQPALAGRFDGSGLPVVVLDGASGAIAAEPDERPGVALDPRHLAYLIYTSGSTGRPKGIMVPHRCVANMGTAEVRSFGTTPGDRVLQVAPLIFDVSIWEMAMTWLAGATLVLASEEDIVSGDVLNDAGITMLAATPSLLATLDAGEYPGIRTVLPVGEACTERIADAWAPGRRAINVYGPTETTGHCTTGELAAGEPVTIGRPIQNVRVYVLNDALEPVPTGVAGELHVSSPGVTRGYVKRPDLTAERFVPDPFSGRPGARMYRTGDLVRHLPDGRLEYLGRLDHQVKVRGFRIELGEIESVLAALPGVAEAVALAREDRPGEKRLVAYVVAADGAVLDGDDLRRDLRRDLPAYMVPAHVVVLDRLPLNPSRKLDRDALPAPEGLVAEHGPSRSLTATEAVVASVWQEVLGVPAGPDDNFFDLGGHSLLGTQVLVRLFDALAVEIPMRTLFVGPTVAELAKAVDEALAAGPAVGDEPIEPIARRRRPTDGAGPESHPDGVAAAGRR
jgi:amino acid adenylation domain-containing protein